MPVGSKNSSIIILTEIIAKLHAVIPEKALKINFMVELCSSYGNLQKDLKVFP